MSENSKAIAIVLLGAPGSGKDYLLNNVFSHFNIYETNIDQILSGKTIVSEDDNVVINGPIDIPKFEKIKGILGESHTLSAVYVGVSNKVSRLRNESRESPISEQKRLEKFVAMNRIVQWISEELPVFTFDNSITLSESTASEQGFFVSQIQSLLETLVKFGLVMDEGIVEEVDEAELAAGVDFQPKLKSKKAKGNVTPATDAHSDISGMPVGTGNIKD